jgi:hypothetical protein
MDGSHLFEPLPPAAPLPVVRDRKTGLVLFGCLQIALAIGALLILALALVSRRMLPPDVAKGSPVAIQVVVWGGVAAVFLALGIGSIQRRRWARILTLVVSGLWLFSGVLGGIVVALVLPGVLKGLPSLGPAARPAFLVAGSVFVFFQVLLPSAFLIFYARRDVAATCEARDTNAGFADRVPLPIFLMALLYALTAAGTLASAFMAVLPYPGGILVGTPAAAILITSAALSAVTAWGVYRRCLWAWWTAIVLSATGTVYGVLTYSRVDPDALYRAQGFDPERLRAPGMPDLFRSPVMWVGMLVWGVLYLAFLMWARRFFPGPGKESLPPTPVA